MSRGWCGSELGSLAFWSGRHGLCTTLASWGDSKLMWPEDTHHPSTSPLVASCHAVCHMAFCGKGCCDSRCRDHSAEHSYTSPPV